jgi:guanylate kinase
MPEAVRIFIAPPSGDALRTRLIGRGDTDEDLDLRLETAREELEAIGEFGHVIYNDRLSDAADELVALVRSYTR